MTDVIIVVNFIRLHGLNHRQFKAFLEEIENEYDDALYCFEVCYLSKDKGSAMFSVTVRMD
jgi:hypothetical protein